MDITGQLLVDNYADDKVTQDKGQYVPKQSPHRSTTFQGDL